MGSTHSASNSAQVGGRHRAAVFARRSPGSPRPSCLRRIRRRPSRAIRRSEPARSGFLKISPARGARPSMRYVFARRSGSAASVSAELGPGPGDDLRDRKSVVGVEDRRRQNVGHRQLAELARASRPSRRRRLVRSPCGCRAAASRSDPLPVRNSGVKPCRRPAAGVQAVQRVGSSRRRRSRRDRRRCRSCAVRRDP